MKKLLLLFGIAMLCNTLMYAQGGEYFGQQEQYFQKSELLTNPTVQPPDVAAFQKVNFIPVSNYTGRASISIPIFNIISGNISVPISLSYNTSGVKVNDIPSSVGSNWALNAGGSISKIVRGMDDFSGTGYGSFNTGTSSHHAGPSGWLFRKYTDQYDYDGDGTKNSLIDWHLYNDSQPDLFVVNAPGLSTQYTHKVANDANPNPFYIGTGGDIFELTGQKNVIEETIGRTDIYGSFIVALPDSGSNDWDYYDGSFQSYTTYTNQLNRPKPNVLAVKDIKITSLNGLIYEFNKFDVSQYTNEQESINLNFGTYNPKEVSSKLKVEAYHLTKIKDQKSNKEVVFEYEQYYMSGYDEIDDYSYIYGSTIPYGQDSKVDAKSTKYPQKHRLTKITYDKGSVEFVYGSTRSDLSGEKALTKIIIKDINGTEIKTINLVYGYMQNSSYVSSVQNKRLRLDEVYTSNSVNNPLPKYKLTYNTTELPPRGTWGNDFLGYSNGTYNSSTSNARPHMYFYPDNGKESMLPISKGSGYYQLNGTYSLASNLTHSKAGILEKIEYPTGGSIELEYELNQFKVDGTAITGGGLRVKNQKIVDDNGNSQYIDYEYKLTDTSSSGSIVSFSNYTDLKVNNSYTAPLTPSSALSYFSFKSYRLSQAQAELTKGSFVGYERVVVKDRVSNGYTEFNYTTPNSHSNDLYTRIVSFYSPTSFNSIVNIAISNGIHGGFINKEVQRGELLSKKIYNKSNVLLLKEENTYTYTSLGSFNYNHHIKISNATAHYDFAHEGDYIGPMIDEAITIKYERNVLTQSIKTDYLDGGSTSVTKNVTYDSTYPLVSENSINDGIKTVLNKYYYPHSSAVSGGSYMSTLRSQNRYSEMIQQEAYNDGTKIYTEKINYASFGNSIYLPNKIYTAKGSETLEEGAIIDLRDANGNILQYHTKDNVYNSFVYGYGNTSLLAKIENASYSNVIGVLPITVTQLQTLDSENDKAILISYFNTVRSGLPNARVTSYTYAPSIGVSSITDLRGRTIYYLYDSFNRLQYVKDNEGNILSENQYNYKN